MQRNVHRSLTLNIVPFVFGHTWSLLHAGRRSVNFGGRRLCLTNNRASATYLRAQQATFYRLQAAGGDGEFVYGLWGNPPAIIAACIG